MEDLLDPPPMSAKHCSCLEVAGSHQVGVPCHARLGTRARSSEGPRYCEHTGELSARKTVGHGPGWQQDALGQVASSSKHVFGFV